jgi:hypothetical protein
MVGDITIILAMGTIMSPTGCLSIDPVFVRFLQHKNILQPKSPNIQYSFLFPYIGLATFLSSTAPVRDEAIWRQFRGCNGSPESITQLVNNKKLLRHPGTRPE